MRNGLTPTQFRTRLLDSFPLDPAKDAAEVSVAIALYEHLSDLEKQQINGIWARIIKNAFAPLFQGRFDYVAGNPPWVNWESLPEDYRRESIPLWHHHGMIPPGGLKSVMGHSKMDISALMTYVAADNYLKDGGKLGFLITQAVFKTSGAGQGFRRFLLGSGTPVSVLGVDDLVHVQPFEGASNRTAAMILLRGRQTRYPVTYYLWRKAAHSRRVAEDSSLEEAQRMCVVRRLAAQPVDETDITSPWMTGRPRALSASRRTLGRSDYQAHAGAYTGGANGVYWLEILERRPDGLVVVSNITEGAKRQVESVQTAIESHLLYPLLRGRDVSRWSAVPQAWILIPKRPGYQEKAIPEDEMKVSFPRAYAYLSRFRDVLDQRRDAVLMRSKGRIPFYSIGAVSDYTFTLYKVVWREVSHRLDAAVAGPAKDQHQECVIPDHTLIMVGCDGAEEAHFICAALNSSPSRFIVQNYIVLHPDPHILQRVRIPRYDPANPTHRRMAALSQNAHHAMAKSDMEQVKAIEVEIDNLAAGLWGLTIDDLREIQQTLAELE